MCRRCVCACACMCVYVWCEKCACMCYTGTVLLLLLYIDTLTKNKGPVFAIFGVSVLVTLAQFPRLLTTIILVVTSPPPPPTLGDLFLVNDGTTRTIFS